MRGPRIGTDVDTGAKGCWLRLTFGILIMANVGCVVAKGAL